MAAQSLAWSIISLLVGATVLSSCSGDQKLGTIAGGGRCGQVVCQADAICCDTPVPDAQVCEGQCVTGAECPAASCPHVTAMGAACGASGAVCPQGTLCCDTPDDSGYCTPTCQPYVSQPNAPSCPKMACAVRSGQCSTNADCAANQEICCPATPAHPSMCQSPNVPCQ